MTARNANRSSGSTHDRIEIPADLIADVRIGAILQLHLDAEKLGYNAELYACSKGPGDRVTWEDYCDAFDDVRRMQEVLDNLGDDFTVKEPLSRFPDSQGQTLAKGIRWQAELLRSRLHDVVENIDGSGLVERARRIEALEALAARCQSAAEAWDAEHAEEA